MSSAFLTHFFTVLITLVFGFLQNAWGKFDFRSENYFSGRRYSLESVRFDPTNRIFNRPDYLGSVDIRPEFKLTIEIQKFILRPRWTYTHESIHYSDTNTDRSISSGKIDLSDAYLESIWSEEVRTTIGLQVYQWGPAEFLNASNPIFHLNTQQRSTLFKEKGKVLLRINMDYSKNWNQVFLYEPISNAERPWIADETFQPKTLVKTEWIGESGIDSFGFVFGKEERGQGFFGEYFNFSPTEGFSFYLDSKHTETSPAYYPDANAYGTESLVYNNRVRGGWASFGVAGLRKEWSHLDFRAEYIYNTGGWTTEQFQDAKVILTQKNPDTPSNYARFASPGLELIGRGYGYLSMRFFNIGKKDNHSIAFRYLLSQADSSSNLTITYDWDFNNFINIFAEFAGSFGSQESELNLLQQQSMMIGFRWSL
tara:strand:+ start:33163 stop:34437 length:1275 start_codon:yes stop_codon:yes gene_type:complete